MISTSNQTIKSVIAWFDSESIDSDEKQGIAWMRIVPFIALHIACFAVFFVGFSWTALIALIATYSIRMFAITGFYHRYFSHKTFKTHQWMETVFAFIGASSAQRGALWWASHHRKHHRHSDTELDLHSPIHGFMQSHMAWFLNYKAFATDYSTIQDFAKRASLKWLNRFDLIAPVALGVSLFLAGTLLNYFFPGLETSGLQLFVWGFVLSTVLLFHVTVSINSIAHIWGSQRYKTTDNSRNNALLALLTFGEGWHNNHHYYPNTVKQGFFWWELDITYWVIKTMSFVGLTWDLKQIPAHVKKLP